MTKKLLLEIKRSLHALKTEKHEMANLSLQYNDIIQLSIVTYNNSNLK